MNTVSVSDLEKKYTNEQQAEAARLYKIRKDMGLVPRCFDGATKYPKFNTPFSKYYNTYEDFVKEQTKVQLYIERKQDIPEDLYNKIKETVDELYKVYGPSTLW